MSGAIDSAFVYLASVTVCKAGDRRTGGLTACGSYCDESDCQIKVPWYELWVPLIKVI